MKVENMMSTKGNTVPNQFIITDDNGYTYFQSYQTIIAKRSPTGNITLDKDSWNYSRTTGKYRNIFLRETLKETERNIKDGTYKLADLN